MSTIYHKATKAVHDLVEEIIEEFHPELKQVEMKIDLLEARATLDDEGFPEGPALTHQGYQALGICRIVNYRDRVKGCGDAEIQIDGDWWDDAEPEQQSALIDHELTHIEIVTGEDGRPRLDPIGRPKIKMRKHDRQFGWFDDVAKRWGKNSVEHQQASQVLRKSFRETYQLELGLNGPAAGLAATLKDGDSMEISGGGKSVKIEKKDGETVVSSGSEEAAA